MSKLQEAGYVEVEKSIVNRKTHSVGALTGAGRAAFEAYRDKMTEILAKKGLT